MIIGDQSRFAVESEMRRAFRNPGLMGEGFFVLHIGGCVYGVRELDAMGLGHAFNRALEQVEDRGQHVAPFARFPSAAEIFSKLQDAWREEPIVEPTSLGLPTADFVSAAQAGEFYPCLFTRGYSEAFDDGSEILRFDVDDQVRLIAAKMMLVGNKLRPKPGTLRDVWLDAEEFYGILQEWHCRFELEWMAAEKERLPSDKDSTTTGVD